MRVYRVYLGTDRETSKLIGADGLESLKPFVKTWARRLGVFAERESVPAKAYKCGFHNTEPPDFTWEVDLS